MSQVTVSAMRVMGMMFISLAAAAWPVCALAQAPRGPLTPLAAPALSAARPGAAASAGQTSLLACLILPTRTADIGSPVVGVVASVEVERGDMVRKGQVLARLRADVEQANSGVARSRAESEAEWRGAVASQDLARIKLERARALKDQNFVSGQAVEQAESEFRIAKERASQVREQLGISSREAGSAAAQVSQRTLRAPFDGVITERYANPGERFEDKPLLRIADISQLRVDVVASTTLFGSLRIGQDVTVRPELPGVAARLAQISQIDRVLDPASNTFRMRLDMPNPAHELPAGLRCKAELGKTEGLAAAPGNAAVASLPAATPATLKVTRVEGGAAAASARGAALGSSAATDSTNTARLPAPAARPPSAPLPSIERLLMDLSPLSGMGQPPASGAAPRHGGAAAPQGTLAPVRR